MTCSAIFRRCVRAALQQQQQQLGPGSVGPCSNLGTSVYGFGFPAKPDCRTQPCSSVSTSAIFGSAYLPLSCDQQTFGSFLHRGYASSSSASCSGAPGGDGIGGSSSGGNEGGKDEPIKMSLQEAVMSLADAAVSKVEEGDLESAILILQEGIKEFGPRFPQSPEVGELHNQVALLLFMQGNVDDSATHAQHALDVTKAAFGPGSVLTGHRLLRMGAVRMGQGQLSEAAQMMTDAIQALGDDASRAEAELYLLLLSLAGATDVTQVSALDAELARCVRSMCEHFGADSMVLRLALAQHDKLVTQALGAQTLDVVLCEALMKQHTRLLEMLDPSSEDLAIAQYKLATFYYTQDLLQDAGQYIRKAAALLRSHYHEDHPLVVMCTHRLGMVCAASGDHRAASQLLTASLQRYKGPDGGGAEDTSEALAKEAELGLALARFRAISPQLSRDARQQAQDTAVAEVRRLLEELVQSIGSNHMLAQGAMRYFAQVSGMAKRPQ